MRMKFWLLAAVACIASCDVPITQNLSESEANRAVMVLEHQGIAASKDPAIDAEGGWQLNVSRGEAAHAIAILARENLPAESSPGVLDALGEGSLVPSRGAEHAKLVQGTAGELERSLRGIEGILNARVHLAVPAKDLLAMEGSKTLPSGSVLLRHRDEDSPISSTDVQSLVAGAVVGLNPEQVSVVTQRVPSATLPREPKFARIGPIAVAPSSLSTLRIVFASVLLTHVALLAAVAFLWLKLRRLQPDSDATSASPVDHASVPS